MDHLHRVSAPAKTLLERQSGLSDASSTQFSTGIGRFSVGAKLVKAEGKGLTRSSLQKTADELRNRSEYHTRVTLNLQILDGISGQHVVYKHDGSRFEHSNATIKVASGEVYRFGVSTKPEVVVEGNILMLRILDEGKVKEDCVVLESLSPGARCVWGTWKCELPPGKNTSRAVAIMSGNLHDFGQFEVPILLKVYKSNDKKLKSGKDLKQVGYDLKRVGDGDASEVKLVVARFA